MRLSITGGLLFFVWITWHCPPAWAAGQGVVKQPVARTVLIVAYNGDADSSLQPLRYADDDGVRYLKLLSPYAARIKLLSVLDDDTQSQNPGIAPLIGRPDRANLLSTLAVLRTAMEQDVRDGRAAEFMFIFVGHGSLDPQGRGVLHLAGGPLTREDLFKEIVAGSPSQVTHLILDACNAYSVIAGRGADSSPGEGAWQALDQFLSGNDLETYPKVGVMLASSDSRETHEWSRIGAGLFSHQLRSALSGAADVNRDGLLEYSEVAAFIDSANAKLPGKEQRQKTFAWPPAQDRHHPLLDLSQGQGTRYVILDPVVSGHLTVESGQQEAWADLHKAAGERVVLALPSSTRFLIHHDRGDAEVPPGSGVAWVRELLQSNTFLASRGTVGREFEEKLFAVPFNQAYYQGFLSGHPHLLAVDEAAPLFLKGEKPPNQLPLRLELDYQLGRFLLDDQIERASGAQGFNLEHQAVLRVGWTGWNYLLPVLSFEGGYAPLNATKAVGSSHFALLLGLMGRYSFHPRLQVQAGVELGYGLLVLHAASPSLDPSVGLFRVRAAIEVRVAGPIRVQFGGSWLAGLVSLDGQEAFRQRPEFQIGVVWQQGSEGE